SGRSAARRTLRSVLGTDRPRARRGPRSAAPAARDPGRGNLSRTSPVSVGFIDIDPPFGRADRPPSRSHVMIRRLAMSVLALALAFPVAARAQQPAGLQLRVDASTDAADPDDVPDVKITATESGFRVAT